MIKKIFFIFLLFIFIFILSGCNQQSIVVEKETNNQNKTVNSLKNYPMSSAELVVDKLEVYYFHRTARCYSCNTAGEYVSKVILESFSNQVKNGVIDFREINVDLPANKEIARKFQATGSSLFINRIIDGQDNIEQDTNIWRLLNNEVKFKKYLETKINSYLGL